MLCDVAVNLLLVDAHFVAVDDARIGHDVEIDRVELRDHAASMPHADKDKREEDGNKHSVSFVLP